MRNKSEIDLFWTSGLGGNFLYRYFLSTTLAAVLFGSVEPFVKFLERAS